MLIYQISNENHTWHGTRNSARVTDRSSPWRHLAVRAIAARSTTQFSFHRERSGDRRDGVSGGKGRGGGGGGSVAAAVTAAMASVTGHCI